MPSQTLKSIQNLEIINFQLGSVFKLKTERFCEISARQELLKIEEKEKKEDNNKITDEMKTKFLNDVYNNCLIMEGWLMPVKNKEKDSYESPELSYEGKNRKFYFAKKPGFFSVLLKEIVDEIRAISESNRDVTFNKPSRMTKSD